MTTLTLKIDRRVVADAEVYAKRTQKSIPQLVEEFLLSLSNTDNAALHSQSANLTRTETIGKSNLETLGPITKRLTGIIKLDRDVDHKELLTNALMEKYL